MYIGQEGDSEGTIYALLNAIVRLISVGGM